MALLFRRLLNKYVRNEIKTKNGVDKPPLKSYKKYFSKEKASSSVRKVRLEDYKPITPELTKQKTAMTSLLNSESCSSTTFSSKMNFEMPSVKVSKVRTKPCKPPSSPYMRRDFSPKTANTSAIIPKQCEKRVVGEPRKIPSRPNSGMGKKAFSTTLDNFKIQRSSYNTLAETITKKSNKYERFKQALAMNKSYSTSLHKKPNKNNLAPKQLEALEADLPMTKTHSIQTCRNTVRLYDIRQNVSKPKRLCGRGRDMNKTQTLSSIREMQMKTKSSISVSQYNKMFSDNPNFGNVGQVGAKKKSTNDIQILDVSSRFKSCKSVGRVIEPALDKVVASRFRPQRKRSSRSIFKTKSKIAIIGKSLQDLNKQVQRKFEIIDRLKEEINSKCKENIELQTTLVSLVDILNYK